MNDAPLAGGVEWIIEAHGCNPERLCDRDSLAALFDDIVAELSLNPVAPAQWHVFAGAGGVTGLCMLAESHLAVHTFPEHGSLCLNLFCCRPRAEWDAARLLAKHVEATDSEVRRVERRYETLQPAHALRPA